MNSKAESWEDRERKKPSSILSGTSPRLLLHAESLHRRLSVRRKAGRSPFGPALKCANKVGPGEVSAAGTPGETGVILLYVPKTSDAAKAGRLAGGILLAFNGKPVRELQDLLQERRQVVAGTAVSVTVLRYQQESTAMILLKP